mgnify:CR=1 FL=1
MAYLKKSQYERRAANSAIRMAKNAEVSSLTEEQHQALNELCYHRHSMHSNIKSCVTSRENNIMASLEKAGVMLAQAGIPCHVLPSDESDYINIDTIDLLYEIEDVPEDDEKRQEWYADNYSRIMSELSELNGQIEDYLRSIDEKHGTSYCPTGVQRIM